MPTDQEIERLSAAIDAVAGEISEAIAPLGVEEHVVLLRILGDDEIELKVVTRADATVAHAEVPVALRALERPADPGMIVVIASDHTLTPSPTLTARIALNPQGEP
jgi:hypothetical protein